MKKSFVYACASAALLMSLCMSPSFGADAPPFIETFHSLKAAGQYRRAIAAAADYAVNAPDEPSATAALYFLEEAVPYAELGEYAVEQLRRISVSDNAALKGIRSSAAYTAIIIPMLVKTGNTADAARTARNAGMPQSLTLTDAFTVHGDEDFSRNKKNESEALSCRLLADNTGVFRMDAVYDEVRNQGFTAETFFSTQEGRYILTAGSSGRIELYVDGKQVYKDYTCRRFSSCRDFIELQLNSGVHSLTVKISGNDRNEASFRISIPGADFQIKKNHDAESGAGQLRSSLRLGVLDGAVSNPFVKGYLLYCAGHIDEDSGYTKAFDEIKDTRSFEWFLSRYYCAQDENNEAMKEKLLRIAAEGGVCAAYEDCARLMIEHKRYSSASAHIDSFASCYPRSPVLPELKTLFALSQLWYEEALVRAAEISAAGYPSRGCEIAAEVYKQMGLAAEQERMLEKAYSYDRSNERIAEKIVKAALCAADGNVILERCAADHPWNIHFKYAYAESLFSRGKSGALAAVTSVLRGAPQHGRALFLAGRICYAMGKRSVAENYFLRAVRASPENRLYQENYTLLFTEKEDVFSPVDFETLKKESSMYSSEPAVCVSNDRNIVLYDDGSTLTSVREVYRIFSKEKTSSLKTLKAVINGNTDELLAFTCRFVSDGVERQSDDVSSRDCSDPENSLYYDLIEYSIKAPDAREGGFIVFEYRIHSTAGRSMRGYYGNALYFDPEYRILHASVNLASKRFIHVKPRLAAADISELRDSEGRRVVTVTMKNLPPARSETGMLPYAQRVPSVYMTTFEDWNRFHDWFRSQMNGSGDISAEMKMETGKLCSGAADDAEKVRRIYRMVTDRIRYSGAEEGLGGYIPRPAVQTWYSRKGDCKDIALLLASLLGTQNIRADIALVRTADSGVVLKDFPSLDSFNHALCRVECGGALYLDGTVKNHDLYDLPVSDRDIDALVLASGKYYFEKIEGARYAAGSEESSTTVTVSLNGDAECKRTLIKRGPLSVQNDNVKDDDRSRDVSRYWNSRYPGAEIKDYRFDKKQTESDVSYTVLINNFAETGNDEIVIPVMLIPFDLKTIWGKTLSRDNDIFIMDERTSAVSVTYVFPEGFTVSDLPADAEFSFSGLRVRYRFTHDKNSFSVNAVFNAKRSVIGKDAYTEFRNIIIRTAIMEGLFIRAERKKESGGL